MDYSQSSVAVSVGLSAGSLSFGERSLSSLTTELGDARHRILGQPMSPGASGILSPNNSLKQCRSTSDMDVDSRDDRRGPLKLARTDSFTRQPDLKMQMTSSGTLGSLVRSNSMVSDGRLGCSPTNSCASDGALIGNEGNFVSETRLLRNDSILSCPQFSPGGTPRVMSFHHQPYSLRPSGLTLPAGRDVISHMGFHENDRGPQAPFTVNQLRELQHQALIFKYIRSGHSVPAELLIPIRNSLVGFSGMVTGTHQLANIGWGNYHLGFATNTDPEPGRCRRTDGKKWRCSRDVVPEQKYCERHMHRGRHRARKPAENNQTNSSQSAAAGASSSSAASSVSLAAARGTTPSSSLRPSIALNTQQNRPPPSLGLMTYSSTNSPTGVGAVSMGSSISGSHYQHPLQSLSATSGLSAKDYRCLNGVAKPDIDLVPEQMFFSEASGSARGLVQESQSINGLSMLSSVNNSWRNSLPSSKVPSAPQPKANNSSLLLQCNSPHQLRCLLGQDFWLMSESNPVNIIPMAQQQQQHQQHSFLGSGFGANVEAVNVGREPEGQPLRHFFDDWPRSRDPATLSWSDVEDERSNRSSSTTQLSMSIPMASSDFTTANASSPRGKLSLNSLKLSMSRAGDDDPLGVDPTQMGLGVGMGLGMNEDRHRQTNWNAVTWETSVGGPLAEVLQSSSTPRGCKSSGLNLMTDAWDNNSPRDSPRMASPAGVLQNAKVGSFSDTSSGATKTEPTLCDNHVRSSDSITVSNVQPNFC